MCDLSVEGDSVTSVGWSERVCIMLSDMIDFIFKSAEDFLPLSTTVAFQNTQKNEHLLCKTIETIFGASPLIGMQFDISV